ncbi:MAG: GNAT family N-acetyltransferase [Ruminococcaceae bacterium]|nr:GNAT family N-acetyltransferase [Oscillospiraceae bacterium]
MSEYNIRPATPEDTDTLVKIALNEWKAIYEGYRQQMGDELYFTFFPDCNADKEAQIRRNVAAGNCFVTECDGKIAGFINYVYSEAEKIGTISNNAVSSEFRGRGIGPRQYEFIFDRLRSLGAIAVKVTTGLDEGHAPARRAYEKAGFSANTKSITYYKKL